VPPPSRLAAHLLMQARHYLGLVLIPPLAIVGLLEALTMAGMSPAHLQASWWLAIPLVGTVLVLMPLAVRRIWHTSPLSAGPLREALDHVCHGRKCPVRDILMWDTDYNMANAAVVGFSRRLRYVLLTDVLIARLNDRQIAAVVRHELAHLRRWHLPLRLALLLLPVAWWMALDHAWPGLSEELKALAASLGVRPQLAAALLLPVGMLGYALAVVGWYSRLLEHDADLDACLDDSRRVDAALAEDFCAALETLCAGSTESRLSQWLHPPVAKRLDMVRRAITKPEVIAAFRRAGTFVAAGMAILYVLAGVLALLG
jgi:Zn-dependent protease with chaperone function